MFLKTSRYYYHYHCYDYLTITFTAIIIIVVIIICILAFDEVREFSRSWYGTLVRAMDFRVGLEVWVLLTLATGHAIPGISMLHRTMACC